jgi:hypothetical protein
MESLDPKIVAEKLKRLREGKADVFGAEYHAFVLNPPLSEEDTSQFEREHRIKLPTDNRDFITQIGNGGAGPYYGVFPLGFSDGSLGGLDRWEERDGFIGVLSEPFPLSEAWNDRTGEPSANLLDQDEEEYEQQLKLYEERYWNPAIVNGTIPICHMGCALRLWLVITGNERRLLWRDGRADGGDYAHNQQEWRASNLRIVVYRMVGGGVPRRGLSLFRGGTSRALLGGDGPDDELVRLLGVQGNFCAMERGIHEGYDLRIVQSGHAFESDMADEIAASHEAMPRIGNADTLKKAEGNMVGIDSDREDGVRRPLVRNETDHQRVVVVIDHFDRAG